MTTTETTEAPATPPRAGTAAADPRMARAMAYVRENFRRRLRLADVAREAGLSMFHFCRMFTRAHGVTFKGAVGACQIDEAKRLMLAGTPLPLVATAVGFSSQGHLTGRFKQIVGQTPARWRRAQPLA